MVGQILVKFMPPIQCDSKYAESADKKTFLTYS